MRHLGLPLYSPTTDFTAVISLFEACGCAPKPTHPEILALQEKRKEEKIQKVQSLQKNINNPWITPWQLSNHTNVEQEDTDTT